MWGGGRERLKGGGEIDMLSDKQAVRQARNRDRQTDREKGGGETERGGGQMGSQIHWQLDRPERERERPGGGGSVRQIGHRERERESGGGGSVRQIGQRERERRGGGGGGIS